MILTATIPFHYAKFGDLVRYVRDGCRQVDIVHDLEPREDGKITTQWGMYEIPHDHVLEVNRVIEIRPGDIWVTDRGYEARILDTAAPGLHPIVALLVRNGTSTPLQFTWCGISATSRPGMSSHHLTYPKSMEDLPCKTPSTTSCKADALSSTN